MRCKYNDKDLMLYYYDEVDSASRAEIKGHLKVCRHCSAALERLVIALNKADVKEPEMTDAFWSNFSAKVNERIDQKAGQSILPLLRPGMAQAVLLAILIMVGVIGGFRIYDDRQETQFIMENYELIMNIDLLEDLELLENLDELETA